MPSEPATKPTPQTLSSSTTNQAAIDIHHGDSCGHLKDSLLDSSCNENPNVSGILGICNSYDGLQCSREGPVENQGDSMILNLRPNEEKRYAIRKICLDEETPSVISNKNDSSPINVVVKKNHEVHSRNLDKLSNEILTLIISHLPATAISTIALVSKRFYAIVTSPHVWRIAFSRFFPGQDTSSTGRSCFNEARLNYGSKIYSETRLFNRLIDTATWRNEYLMRTRLLQCLRRGRPIKRVSKPGELSFQSNNTCSSQTPVITYSSRLNAPVRHIHAIFNTGSDPVRFVHGSSESGNATISDAKSGKTENWGLAEPQDIVRFDRIWTDQHPVRLDDVPMCVSNSMDVSQPFGVVVGEGSPGGKAYFRCKREMRRRHLQRVDTVVDHRSGIPHIPKNIDAISAVWIAKSRAVPEATNGLVGILLGSTLGLVTAYSLGVDNHLTIRIPKGTVTAKWVLSPGVPIIAFDVDDSYNMDRKANGRIWAVALNSLGEIFYLTQTPSSSLLETKIEESELGRQAWLTGRTVHWNIIDSSLRIPRDDTYHDLSIDRKYSPRSSCNEMNLQEEELIFETHQIEKFLQFPPSHFRKICYNWDMQQILHVDFAGSDNHKAGEGIFVIKRGVTRIQQAQLKRYTRWKKEQASSNQPPLTAAESLISNRIPAPTIIKITASSASATSLNSSPKKGVVNRDFHSGNIQPGEVSEEWRSSLLSLKDHPNVEITCSGIDMSKHALLTLEEDPLCPRFNKNHHLSPNKTCMKFRSESFVIPGHRARYLAVGTKAGVLIIWNMRGPQSIDPVIINEILPLRTIYTDSPEISCLALSALYIVHGGNDGLVQAWDPLASSTQPIRTLNSRFSTPARRRLLQADRTNLTTGPGSHAAGAILLDPNPTALRGIVSLGTQLKYWEYSSADDEYRSKKRRLRRPHESESNGNSAFFSGHPRGALKKFIDAEYNDLKKESVKKSSQDAHLRHRFGVGLGDLTEDEALLYAQMISAEEFTGQINNQTEVLLLHPDKDDSDLTVSVYSSENASQASASTSELYTNTSDTSFELEIEEAIRLSLMEGPGFRQLPSLVSKTGTSA